jgi:hypothetical protein
MLMKHPLRSVALLYAICIMVVAIWALSVDITMRDSAHEHLLPDVTLAFLAWPCSILLGRVYEAWPHLFSDPLAQLGGIAVCGWFQAWILWMIGRMMPWRDARKREPNEPS